MVDPAEAASTDSPDSGLPASELLPLVHGELRRLAKARMGCERRDHTLGATALVHEAYLRLSGDGKQAFANCAEFFVAAAEAMRRILIEHARARGRLRRGGGRQPITLSSIDLGREEDLDQVLVVDEAIERLARAHPRCAEVVRLRFYAGLGEEETAAGLGVSVRSVRRDWSFARAWLFDALQDPP